MLEGEFDDERNDGHRMILQSQSLYDFFAYNFIGVLMYNPLLIT